MHFINLIALILTDIFFIFFCISSIFEKEKRAAFISFIFIMGNTAFWIFLIRLNYIKPILYLTKFCL